MKLAVKYIIFAVIATLVNISFQWLSLKIYDLRFSLYVAMFFGTIAGLAVKYVLDKKYIFYHKTETKTEDAKKFLIYSCMGVFTTVIFWGTELSFHYIWDNPVSKYIGAVTGLSIGYITKYRLDKRFVFRGEK